MPQSKAHMEATNRYNAKAYDNLRIVVPRGRKAEIDVLELSVNITFTTRKLLSGSMQREARKEQCQ